MSQVERYVKSIEFLRELFMDMDAMAEPVMGIRDWDDSVCINFCGGKLLASTDGPYSKRLVMKSALIHASTDVVVKGGRPLFCLNTLIGLREDVRDMAESLKRQARAMEIPVLGGNTLFEGVEPRCSITVVGELILKKPIRDSGAREGDSLILLGEPLWGSQEERIQKAKTLFRAWYQILDSGIKVNASKDVTKGGLNPTMYEMSEKSGREFDTLEGIPLPVTRNLDNFLLSVSGENKKEIKEIAERNKCLLYELGSVK
ncbi:MAG: hypothetical protein B6U72_00275 [Candidatus Altiarchaeales archaeon ex4484_2]|nr:MAG: hypothetical protein B6U72_00275 [Candidatus Altiarchaeales archaeon ex4484_2]